MFILNLTVSVVKEFAELVLRNIRKYLTKWQSEYDLSLVGEQGYAVIENYLSTEECQKLRDEIDRLIASKNVNVWRDEQDSDNRIYFSEKLSAIFSDFFNRPDLTGAMKSYTGYNSYDGLLLAARLTAKVGNLGSGGGWHRDSPVTHQFKAIVYLDDVDETNGPFQYIPKSNSKTSVLKAYLKKIFKPGQYRFSDDEVEQYCKESGSSVVSLTGRKGTLLLADTKGIHRGMPIEEGNRYTLFCYYWPTEIPKHFDKYRQNID